MSCATVGGRGSLIDDMMKAPTETQAEWRMIKEKGWVPLHDNGNTWNLYAVRDGHMVAIAQCRYQYIKYRGVEMWRGSYFYGNNELDAFSHYLREGSLKNLSGCVDWVNHQVIGDLYI